MQQALVPTTQRSLTELPSNELQPLIWAPLKLDLSLLQGVEMSMLHQANMMTAKDLTLELKDSKLEKSAKSLSRIQLVQALIIRILLTELQKTGPLMLIWGLLQLDLTRLLKQAIST